MNNDSKRLGILRYFTSTLQDMKDVPDDILAVYNQVVDSFGALATDKDRGKMEPFIDKAISADMKEAGYSSIDEVFDNVDSKVNQLNTEEDIKKYISWLTEEKLDKKKVGICNKGHLRNKKNGSILLGKGLMDAFEDDVKDTQLVIKFVNARKGY